jgi:1-phosphatidylinositol phosphodiesterase
MLALALPAAAADATAAYSHDSTTGATNQGWMGWLPNNALLSELTLPGTHDSGASRLGDDSVVTQSMALADQLNAGIRAWDIRLGKDPIDNRLKIYHNFVWQGQDFQTDVLATADRYLAASPTETVVMRVKHETGPEDGFDTMVKAGLDRYPRVYTGSSDNPALGDIRGKIVVLQDFSSATRMGIPWGGLAIQDNYNMTTNWDLADKWRAIKGQLDTSQFGPRDTTYVNFLSASGGSFPYFVASGNSSPATGAPNLLTGMTRGVIDTCNSQCVSGFPSEGCFLGTCSVAFEGTNILTKNEINRRGWPNRYGIVMADFPGASLIHSLIVSNDYRDYRSSLQVTESNRCLTVPDASQDNSTIVTVADCHVTPNQIWAGTPYGQLTVYGSKCLDVRKNATTDGTPVQIYDCNNTGAQVWLFKPGGLILNPDSGKCLDTTGHGANGATLVIWTCHGGVNQQWTRA